MKNPTCFSIMKGCHELHEFSRIGLRIICCKKKATDYMIKMIFFSCEKATKTRPKETSEGIT